MSLVTSIAYADDQRLINRYGHAARIRLAHPRSGWQTANYDFPVDDEPAPSSEDMFQA